VQVYDDLIKYSCEYAKTFNSAPTITEHGDKAAEVAYFVLRISKGDVRLRLGILARKLGLKHRSLVERFRKLYGTTPKDCQIRLRIDWVCNAIRTYPDRKLSSIAADAGYNDTADFNHVFRKYTGVCPREYQRRHRHVENSSDISTAVH
jgi:AraC-like DNA-binding protein